MTIALSLLTWMFLLGLAGSSIVAVLFIVELLSVTLSGNRGETAPTEAVGQ